MRIHTPAVYITNAHRGTCTLCRGPIVPGQGAYVRQDGKGANHSAACEPWCDRHGRTYGEAQGCPDCFLD